MKNSGVSTGFVKLPRTKRGYSRRAVNAFLKRARKAFENDEPADEFGSRDIRHKTFRLVWGGYNPAQVDAAMERLEEVFADREKVDRVEEEGPVAVLQDASTTVMEITARLARPAGKRFERAPKLVPGYSVAEVDAFAERLIDHFLRAHLVDSMDVRSIRFSAQRGGYVEAQVDALIDTVLDVMLSVREDAPKITSSK